MQAKPKTMLNKKKKRKEKKSSDQIIKLTQKVIFKVLGITDELSLQN